MDIVKRLMHFCLVLICVQTLGLLLPLCLCDNSQIYKAAVLEFARFEDTVNFSASEILQKHLEVYQLATEKASENDVDIIVFPEGGLFPYDIENRENLLSFAEDVPDPKFISWNPCNEEEALVQQKTLRALSCLAQSNNIYIVANLVDIKQCKNRESTCFLNDLTNCVTGLKECKSDGLKLLNANVVFNRNGTLISRYHKQHLFLEMEPHKDEPDDPENAYFETEFGLFTTFVCFDICFKEAVNAIEDKPVKNVAFPTYWFDTFPFATALQFHQSWAITNKVNLLSANVHYPGSGTMGSAIYSGTRGALVYTFDPNGQTKLLISEVPKDPEDATLLTKSFKSEIIHFKDNQFIHQEDENRQNTNLEHCSRQVLGLATDGTREYRCIEMNMAASETTSIKLEKSFDNLKTCSNGFCCYLKYNTSSIKDTYYLISYHSVQRISGKGLCFQTCLLVLCDNTTKPCATYPLDTKTKFNNLELTGNFTTAYIYPSILKNGMRLVPIDNWQYKNEQIQYQDSSSEGEEIISVSLVGRCYNEDLRNFN